MSSEAGRSRRRKKSWICPLGIRSDLYESKLNSKMEREMRK